MEHHLLEAIYAADVKEIEDDIRTFMKNITRIKTSSQLFELQVPWNYWLDQTFHPFVKKLTLKNTMWEAGDFKQLTELISRLSDTVEGLFQVTKKQEQAYQKKRGYTFFEKSHQAPDILDFNEFEKYETTIIRNLEQVTWGGHKWGQVEIQEALDEYKQYYFNIWSSNVASRYVNANKVITDILDRLYFGFDRMEYLPVFQNDKYTTINGVRIHLLYPDKLEKNIYSMLERIGTWINIFKDHEIKKLLNNMNLTIDFLDPKWNGPEAATSATGQTSAATGWYNPKSHIKDSEIILTYYSLTDNYTDTIVTLTHEVGHKYYYEVMTSNDRDSWEEVFDELTDEDPVSDLDWYLKQSSTWFKLIEKELSEYARQYIKFRQSTQDNPNGQPNSALISRSFWDIYQDFDTLWDARLCPIFTSPQWHFNAIDIFGNNEKINEVRDYVQGSPLLQSDRNKIAPYGILTANNAALIVEDFYHYIQKKISEAKKTVKKDFNRFPTQYAGKNASELFAETFAAVCLRKQSTISSWKPYIVSDWLLDKYRRVSGLKESIINRQ